MKKAVDYTLYLVTNRELMSSKTIEESVKEAIKGGCTIVQLREKDISSKEFYDIAKSLRKITKKHKVPFIINDRVDIALAVNADGVHVGQSDLSLKDVRKLIGKNKIIGVSCGNLEEAKKAYKDGADYLGVGAVFPTNTKKDAKDVGIDGLKEIINNIPLPIVAIGGINKENIENLRDINLAGVALVSAIISQKDVKNSAKEIKKIYKNKIKKG